MNGKVLDTITLLKPADWEADYVVRNLVEQYFISNYTSFDFLEDTGAPACKLCSSLPSWLPLAMDTYRLCFYCILDCRTKIALLIMT